MDTKQIVGWLMVVATVNLGLQGLMGQNLIEEILSPFGSMIIRIVYIIIGVAGAYKAYMMLSGKYTK